MRKNTRAIENLPPMVSGEEVVITKHEKPVARLIPEGRASLASIREAALGLQQLRKEIAKRTSGKSKLTPHEVKSAVEEGRR